MKSMKLNEIIKKYTDPTGQTLSILEDIQAKDGYLSREVLSSVAEKQGFRCQSFTVWLHFILISIYNR